MLNSYNTLKKEPEWPQAFLEAYWSESRSWWADYYYRAVLNHRHEWSTKKRTVYGGSVTAGHGKKYRSGSNGKYFGTLGHDALEFFYTTGEFPFGSDREAYIGATQFNLARLQYEDGAYVESSMEEIETACRLVVHTLTCVNDCLRGDVVAAEQRLSSKRYTKADGKRLYGKTDLLVFSPLLYQYGFTGGLSVVDYKFAKSENKTEWREQVSTYIKMLKEHYEGSRLRTSSGRSVDPELELVSACIVWVRAHKKTKQTLIDFIFYDASGKEVLRKRYI